MNETLPPSAETEEEWQALPASLTATGSTILGEATAHAWALVLHARSIPYALEHSETGCQLLTPKSAYNRAMAELQQYAAENHNWPPPTPPVRDRAENTLATVSVLLLLACFHNITLLDISLNGRSLIDWQAIGAAQTAKILNGEWWRTVTALTLHANLPHLLSNLTIGGFFIVCLCRELGAGLSWLLLLGSGILGNLINALVQSSLHTSVGASTVVFGAVGLLSAISLLRHRHQLRKRWGLPLGAAVALLAVLGTEGERTDLGAHLFGFTAGLVLGLLAEYLLTRIGPPSRGFAAFLALICAATVAAAWWLALLTAGQLIP